MSEQSSLRNYDDFAIIFEVACAVPLPCSPILAPINDASAVPPINLFDYVANIPLSNSSAPIPPATSNHVFSDTFARQQSKPQGRKKRVRQTHTTDFGILDEVSSHLPPFAPSPPTLKKKAKKARRSVLGEISGNAMRLPQYRNHAVGYGFRVNDPNYEDFENFENFVPDPRPPPPSPRVEPSMPRWTPHQSSPRPRPQRTQNTQHPETHLIASAAPVSSEPVCLVLYNLLGLESWKVDNDEIKAAYRRVAVINHPDKAAQEDKELATTRMQQINAAKDILLDSACRTKYHETGKLPF